MKGTQSETGYWSGDAGERVWGNKGELIETNDGLSLRDSRPSRGDRRRSCVPVCSECN